METDAITAPEVRKPPVPSQHQPQQRDSNEPNLVDEAGLKKWSNDMLKGHPGGRASTWEQWGNSFIQQFKGAMDTVSFVENKGRLLHQDVCGKRKNRVRI